MDTSKGMWVKRSASLMVWALLVLNIVGAENVKSSTSDGGEAVVAYWERKLHGAMPSSIHAMLTPLSSHQATQLLITSRFLPSDAATFCKAARIKCVQVIPSRTKTQDSSLMPLYHSERQSKSDENLLPFYQSDAKSDENLLPFYQSKSKSDENLLPFYQSHAKSDENLLPFYQSDAKSNENLLPFYQSKSKSDENLLPFYQSKSKSDENLLPFYQSHANSDENLLPFYQSDAKSDENLLPFYQSKPKSDENLLPFYQSSAKSDENLLPFYQSNAKSDENLLPFYQSKSKSDENLLPFYQSHAKSDENLIPFYHSKRPSIMQNDALHKEPGEVSSQAVDRSSPKLTEVPLSLLSPVVREVAYGFREKQVLVAGQKIYVNIAHDRQGGDVGVDERAFLPRKLARLFPLQNGGSKIASMLGISRESLTKTIDQCAAQSKNDYQHAEVKACLTSLEDVVDFVSNIMGPSKPIKVYDAISNASTYKFVGKTFTVLDVETLKQDQDEPSVSCHDMHFPFHVFYCHYAKQTKSFSVTLQSEDGSVHARIVNCHYDTSYWDPHHIAFQQLHFKPGEGEICHWLGPTWMEESGWVFLHA